MKRVQSFVEVEWQARSEVLLVRMMVRCWYLCERLMAVLRVLMVVVRWLTDEVRKDRKREGATMSWSLMTPAKLMLKRVQCDAMRCGAIEWIVR